MLPYDRINSYNQSSQQTKQMDIFDNTKRNMLYHPEKLQHLKSWIWLPQLNFSLLPPEIHINFLQSKESKLRKGGKINASITTLLIQFHGSKCSRLTKPIAAHARLGAWFYSGAKSKTISGLFHLTFVINISFSIHYIFNKSISNRDQRSNATIK